MLGCWKGQMRCVGASDGSIARWQMQVMSGFMGSRQTWAGFLCLVQGLQKLLGEDPIAECQVFSLAIAPPRERPWHGGLRTSP